MRGVHLYTLLDMKNVSAYEKVSNAFSVAPSDTIGGYYETMMDALEAAGSLDKCDIFQFMSAHNLADSQINWNDPGTNNPIATNTPIWTQYQGFTSTLGPPKGYVDCNYKANSDGDKYKLDDATVIVGTGNTVVDLSEFGARVGSSNETRINGWSNGTSVRASLNGNYVAIPNTLGKGIGHFGATRNSSPSFKVWQNKTSSTQARASASVTSRGFWATTANTNDSTVEVTLKQVRYVWAGGYLTDVEYGATIDAIEACLDSLGTGLIT